MFHQKPFLNTILPKGIPVIQTLGNLFYSHYISCSSVSITKHTHALLERLQHMNYVALCRKTKVCGYKYEQQAGKWFYFFRVLVFLVLFFFLCFFLGGITFCLFVLTDKNKTKKVCVCVCVRGKLIEILGKIRIEMGSRATTRSSSGHQLLTHSDIRSTRCLAQLHKAL